MVTIEIPAELLEPHPTPRFGLRIQSYEEWLRVTGRKDEGDEIVVWSRCVATVIGGPKAHA